MPMIKTNSYSNNYTGVGDIPNICLVYENAFWNLNKKPLIEYLKNQQLEIVDEEQVALISKDIESLDKDIIVDPSFNGLESDAASKFNFELPLVRLIDKRTIFEKLIAPREKKLSLERVEKTLKRSILQILIDRIFNLFNPSYSRVHLIWRCDGLTAKDLEWPDKKRMLPYTPLQSIENFLRKRCGFKTQPKIDPKPSNSITKPNKKGYNVSFDLNADKSPSPNTKDPNQKPNKGLSSSPRSPRSEIRKSPIPPRAP